MTVRMPPPPPKSKVSIFIRILYLVFDGIVPIFLIGYGLWDEAAAPFIVMGLVLVFILTMVQYTFLVEEGHIDVSDTRSADMKFVLALVLPLIIVGMEWLIVGGSWLHAWIMLSLFYILSRTIGHLMSVLFAPAFTRSLNKQQERRYYFEVVPAMGAFMLFIFYPLYIGVERLVIDYLQPLDLRNGLALAMLVVGLIVNSIRYAKMFNPQGFIDYLGTMNK